MSKIIVLYNYNKYYNRRIFKLPTFSDYQALITPVDNNTPAAKKGFIRNKVNFDFVDGVHASLVLNIAKSEQTTFKVDQPDYCVVETEYKEGEGVNQTTVKQLSRWFILESTKIRGNQWEISLRRDLLADYYEPVLQAPVFVERGIPLINDPAVFNKEGFTFNQIKQNELLLNFDKHSGRGGGWIVGYMAREDGNGHVTHIDNAEGHAEVPEGTYQFDDLPSQLKSLITNGVGYFNKANTFLMNICSLIDDRSSGVQARFFNIHGDGAEISVDYGEKLFENGGGLVPTYPYSPYLSFELLNGNKFYLSQACEYLRYYIAYSSINFGSDVQTWYNSLTLTNRFTDTSIFNYNNIIYEKDGRVYKLRISSLGKTAQQISLTPSQISAGSGASPALAVDVKTLVNNYLLTNTALNRVIIDPAVNNSKIAVYIGKEEEKYAFISELAEYDTVKTSIPDTRNENLEAPYDLFCIPVSPNLLVKSSGVTVLQNADNIALAIARGIAVKGTTSIVYDVQILPYCPFDEILDYDGNIDIGGFQSGKDYSYITKEVSGVTTNVGIVIYPKHCRGTFDLSITNSMETYSYCIEETSSVIDKKIKAETNLIRFVSPNFASIYEINVQKNKGITSLNVDYFYKPYSPYIHVAPYFNGLYGQDFNDPKGLICSGDFSIATASSKWEEYQIANKNYELIFNRQLQNLDVNNAIAYEQLEFTGKLGVATSALQGIAAGAITGATIGSAAGPWGAAIGAVGGAVVGGVTSGIASSVGAKKDLEYLARQQREARSYMENMYTYQLGNIQALPNTLTKVSTFTENNKIFPFIEFYDCTNVEKEALRNKIQYNGMTVMRIGRIMDFIGETSKYVQGQLIRLEGINEDSHVVAEIANEIKQGAYYYGTDSE